MKKMKFLSGINAIFALAAVALATTFTSCEKEDFNVNTEPVEPVNATATVNAKVILIEDGVSRVLGDNEVEVKYEPARTFTGNPNLAAQTVTITAKYVEAEATMKVDIPALSAGQSVVVTPTIVLTRNSVVVVEPKPENDEKKETVPVDPLDNYSEYYYYAQVPYVEKAGMKYVGTEIHAELTEEEALTVTTYADLVKSSQNYSETKKTLEVYVGAMSRTTVDIAYSVVRTNYEFWRNTIAQTKAIGDKVKLATVISDNYQTTTTTQKADQQIPGHDKAPMGHGHGLSHDHGHGNGGNAGGGIVDAD